MILPENPRHHLRSSEARTSKHSARMLPCSPGGLPSSHTMVIWVAHERRRDSAYSWTVFEDPAVESRFLEVFLAESWHEPLRHHSRATKSDRPQEEAIRWCIKGTAPVTTHLIQVHRSE